MDFETKRTRLGGESRALCLCMCVHRHEKFVLGQVLLNERRRRAKENLISLVICLFQQLRTTNDHSDIRRLVLSSFLQIDDTVLIDNVITLTLGMKKKTICSVLPCPSTVAQTGLRLPAKFTGVLRRSVVNDGT